MDDFAVLSSDIIYDVLQFAYLERLSGKQSFIVWIGGRWGEIAEKIRYSTLRGNKIKEYGLHGCTDCFTVTKNRKDVSVNSIRLSAMSDFTEIHHLLENAYESLKICNKGIPRQFLEKLGNRFTTIFWVDGEKSCHNECKSFDVTDVDFKEWCMIRRTYRRLQLRPAELIWVPLDGEIDFLKRQLKSPHLRNLKSNNPLLARPEFIDLLVDFVKKKNFQTLKSTSMNSLSRKIFEAADEAWLQRKDAEHLPSSVSALISTADLRKITFGIPNGCWTERFEGFSTEWSYSKRHPTTKHYYSLMTYRNSTLENAPEFTMEFSRGKTK